MKSFIAAFEKTAATSLPNWLHKMQKGVEPKLPTYSKKGVLQMWKRRMAK